MTSSYDNSSMDSYKRCPRAFYFRHVRHLFGEGTKPSLAFGGAWGSAMDALWTARLTQRMSKADAFDAAVEAWRGEWTNRGMELELAAHEAEELSPRLPATAMRMLADYIREREALLDPDQTELISCEQPFEVPLPPSDCVYTGLFDKLVQHRGQVLCIEHKTTSLYAKGGPFRSTYVDGWSMNSQVDGYLYALSRLYPKARTAVWVDAALVHKTVSGFQIIPVEKQRPQLQAWQWEATFWASLIETDKRVCSTCPTETPIMYAFPKNTNGCYAYNTSCQYMDMCRAWSNPLARADQVPPGFTIEEWDPLERGQAPVIRVPLGDMEMVQVHKAPE